MQDLSQQDAQQPEMGEGYGILSEPEIVPLQSRWQRVRKRLTPKPRSGAYKSWCNMRTRCGNPNTLAWENYGGRGITVDPAWASFQAFLSDMGDRPDGHSLDRINPDGNYEKSNCRWIPYNDQAKTTRKYLSNGACMVCSGPRARWRGRCHKCNEYLRRNGEERPPVDDLKKHRMSPRKCHGCNRITGKWVNGTCVWCYRKVKARYYRCRDKAIARGETPIPESDFKYISKLTRKPNTVSWTAPNTSP